MDRLGDAKRWLKQQEEKLDEVIAKAAFQFHQDHYTKSNYIYDLKTCNKESFRLIQGGDLCYDRFTVGLSYSTWYHARRVNTILLSVLDMMHEYSGDRETIDVYDLGAGTGAVLWALALSKIALEHIGEKIPNIHIRILDASPFMLDYAKNYLMPFFYEAYPQAQKITTELTVNSWINNSEKGLVSPWVFASYLFDHHENHEQVEETFQSLIKDLNPELVVLSTSKQSTKISYLNTAVQNVKSLGFAEKRYAHQLIFNGNLAKTYAVRNKIQHWNDVGFINSPNWDRDRKTFQTVALYKEGTREMALSQKTVYKKRLSMYQAPITVRRELQLNEEQKDAAIPNGRPTIIRGPAGCGKSVIITERIKNICEEKNFDTFLKILLTTFNKELSHQLYKWMEDLIGNKATFERINLRNPHWEVKFHDSSIINLYIMHFDILPTRLCNPQAKNYNPVLKEDEVINVIENIIEEYVSKKGIQPSRYKHILNPRFIYDEYVRIIYGLQCFREKEYMEIERIGRIKRLNRNGKSRKIVWDVILKFLRFLKENNKDTFVTIRHKYYKSIRKGYPNESLIDSFDYLFVDEFQDCTQTDYKIFYSLLNDPNHLLIAGDYAQAVHLGNSSDIPRVNHMGYFDWKDIKGSYRLPMWVSHGIKPLTEYMKSKREDSAVIQPYKGAPPGSRIMFVYGKSTNEIANKIIKIIETYSIYDLEEWDPLFNKKAKGVSVLEIDYELSRAINKTEGSDIKAFSDTILRLKGIEKKCIIWSTRAPIEDSEVIMHFVYTILSRTAGLCIIALFDNIPAKFKQCISYLNDEFISFWDFETESFYNNIIQNSDDYLVEEEVVEYD